MKIKKNAFSTFVLELFFPSTANCRIENPKNPKIDFPYWAACFKAIFSSCLADTVSMN
jgi:hypothetical protein